MARLDKGKLVDEEVIEDAQLLQALTAGGKP